MNATSSIYLVASPEQTRQHEQDRLRTRHRGDEATWQEPGFFADGELQPWPLHVPVCARLHLREYLRIASEKNIGDLVNLMQDPRHMAPCRRLVAPTLLRGSLLWSLSCRRLVHPIEYLLMQGMQHPFAAALTESFSEFTIRQMAGNAMHVQQVGASFLLVFALLAELRRATD